LTFHFKEKFLEQHPLSKELDLHWKHFFLGFGVDKELDRVTLSSQDLLEGDETISLSMEQLCALEEMHQKALNFIQNAKVFDRDRSCWMLKLIMTNSWNT
jgi:hypothetical protein